MALVLVVAATGCSTSSLDGSIGDTMSLKFDRVKIKKQDVFLVTEYLRDTIRGTEKVCKLSLDTGGMDLDAGAPNLKAEEFLARVNLQRVTFDQDEFPEMEKGRLRFDHFDFRDGGSVEGDFLIVFVDSTTLQGLFIGSVDEL
jgi:hypothetical protein